MPAMAAVADRPDAGMGRGPRGRLALVLVGLLALLLFSTFVALGWWQVERRAWKLDLIDRVDARLAADPVAAPGPGEWLAMDGAAAEYLPVSARGAFLYDRTTFVDATTELGWGFWAMTPLVTERGFTLIVNRGFVPRQARGAPLAGPPAPVAVTGLLRLSEPGGGILRDNNPAENRWYSRDIGAIAAARGLAPPVVPYFVDAAANGPRPPVGGLTVVDFRNSHLVYALTWFALAGLVVGCAAVFAWDEWRLRHAGLQPPGPR